jgi:hypothetical protein
MGAARQKGWNSVGTLRLITVAFQKEIERMARQAKHVIVLETILANSYIKAEAAHFAEVSFLPGDLWEIQDPEDILRKIREVPNEWLFR